MSRDVFFFTVDPPHLDALRIVEALEQQGVPCQLDSLDQDAVAVIPPGAEPLQIWVRPRTSNATLEELAQAYRTRLDDGQRQTLFSAAGEIFLSLPDKASPPVVEVVLGVLREANPGLMLDTATDTFVTLGAAATSPSAEPLGPVSTAPGGQAPPQVAPPVVTTAPIAVGPSSVFGAPDSAPVAEVPAARPWSDYADDGAFDTSEGSVQISWLAASSVREHALYVRAMMGVAMAEGEMVAAQRVVLRNHLLLTQPAESPGAEVMIGEAEAQVETFGPASLAELSELECEASRRRCLVMAADVAMAAGGLEARSREALEQVRSALGLESAYLEIVLGVCADRYGVGGSF